MDLKAFALLLCLGAPAFAAIWPFDLTPNATVPTLTIASSGNQVADTTTAKPSTSTISPEPTTKPTPSPTPETTTVTPTTPAPTPETTTVTTTTSAKPTPAPTPETTTVTPTTSAKPTPSPTPETTTVTSTTPAPTPETTTVTTTTSAKPTPAPTPETTTVTTTTTAPDTTTTAKPTPAPEPTTSTAAPPTTSTAAPATVGEWVVKDVNNISCVVAQMDFHLNVSYPTTLNKTEYIVLTPKTIDVNGTTVDGTCGNATQTIVIPLSQGSLTLQFALDSSKSSLTAINLNVTGLPDSIGNVSSVYNESSPLFVTPVKMSYKCNKEQTVTLTDIANNSTAQFVFADAQLQAFRTDSAINFSDAQDCEGGDTPDLVPIAVGISLGVMIIVVLVAYLIGRRRSQSRGYVSM